MVTSNTDQLKGLVNDYPFCKCDRCIFWRRLCHWFSHHHIWSRLENKTTGKIARYCKTCLKWENIT